MKNKVNNLNKTLCLIALLTSVAIFTGCGTTSNFKPVAGADIRGIQKYSQVAVLDFGNQTGNKTDATPQQLQARGKAFADTIAYELEKTKAFEMVIRTNSTQPGLLLVTGNITRCTEGSASLRLWIGMGAGRSYFDAAVGFADAHTGQKLGEILVDKNSWGLGGAIAASQTVDVFMQAAASTIAEQIGKVKNTSRAGN